MRLSHRMGWSYTASRRFDGVHRSGVLQSIKGIQPGYGSLSLTVRESVLRLEKAENDTNAIPSINSTAPNMRKCGGAGSQGALNRNPFGLTDNMANRWSVVKRTLMATASKPTMIMSHPVNRTTLRRNCNLSRRSNRRAALMFGDFISVPCKTSVAVERPLGLDNTMRHWRIGLCVSVRPIPDLRHFAIVATDRSFRRLCRMRP